MNATDAQPERRERPVRKWIWIWVLGLILVGVIAWFWGCDIAIFPYQHTATVLVMEDSDVDFRTPPFEDIVTAFGPNAKSARLVTNLNLCQTVGGGRALSVSPDGRFFVVCEMVGKHLIGYELPGGKRLWSIDGEFTAATVASNGTVYAVISSGTIYGDQTVLIEGGRISKSVSKAGFDLALDAEHEALWLVGNNIKKCDLALNVLQEFNPIGWCAVSVDVTPDGSIWVAERSHPNVTSSTNRLLQVSANGQLIRRSIYLEWEPLCVRVDPSDGAVWVTGIGVSQSVSSDLLHALERLTGKWPLGKGLRNFLESPRVWTRTHKYDADGRLLCELKQGGTSLGFQSSDGSVWVAGKDKIYHYSRAGTRLGRLTKVSSEQKYVVVVPEAKEKVSPQAQ